jgi:hypothetical protein
MTHTENKHKHFAASSFVFKDLCGGTEEIHGPDYVRRRQSILYCDFARINEFWHRNGDDKICVLTGSCLPVDTSWAAQSHPVQSVPASCRQDSVHFNYHITNLMFGLIINYCTNIFVS